MTAPKAHPILCSLSLTAFSVLCVPVSLLLSLYPRIYLFTPPFPSVCLSDNLPVFVSHLFLSPIVSTSLLSLFSLLFNTHFSVSSPISLSVPFFYLSVFQVHVITREIDSTVFSVHLKETGTVVLPGGQANVLLLRALLYFTERENHVLLLSLIPRTPTLIAHSIPRSGGDYEYQGLMPGPSASTIKCTTWIYFSYKE